MIIEIAACSPAGRALRDAATDEDTHTIRIEPRADGVAIKRNEGMWTATLATTVAASLTTSTYADAFGVWHACVIAPADAPGYEIVAAAKRAIGAEIDARAPRGAAPWRPDVLLIDTNLTRADVTSRVYREA